MSDREFLERVEAALRNLDARTQHISRRVHAGTNCDRCRLQQLIAETIDRAARLPTDQG